MKLFNSTNRSSGYNFRMDSSTGMICSEETRSKMRESHKGRVERFPHLKDLYSKSPEWMKDPVKLKDAFKKVSNTRRKYDIAKIDYNSDTIIKIYKGMIELKELHPDYYRQAILGCCNGGKNSYKGFKWCYIDRITGKIVKK